MEIGPRPTAHCAPVALRSVPPAAARLIAEPLDLDWTPAQAALALRGDRHPFALVGAWAGGGALVGSEPVRVGAPGEDPFALLDAQPVVDPSGGRAGAVGGGWVGYLGYALGHRVEELPPPPPPGDALPPFALAFYDHVLRLDADGRWWFEALETPARAAALAARRAELAARVPVVRPFRAGPFAPAGPGAAGLRDAVGEAVERIHAGELFQANLTLRIEGAFSGDPIDAFATAAGALQPRHGAFLAGPWGATIGLSPELFLLRRGREVLTRPIKGTIPRAEDDAAAADAARAALVGSAKDRAENVMIVDLMRNDLGRVCAYGSIEADAAPTAEPHPGVWHLVTGVHGRLREGVGDAELLRATFPPGSVTGAPKVQALRVISELEPLARHVYTGAVGFASPIAGLELNVAIRTFELRDGRAWLGAGGGIVADSDPDAEVREALDKARPLVRALGARLDPGRLQGTRRPAARALAAGRDRPDPAAGVFETLAVRAGAPVALAAHLDRLSGSVGELYGLELPATLAGEVRDRARAATPGGPHRLRIDAVPGAGGRLAIELTLRPASPTTDAPVTLVPWTLPGGLGPHKWRDRRLLEALTEAGDGLPLLVDADGAVLEAAMSNVWLLEGDTLVTPPADGRLLPGVTRARLLEAHPRARVEPVDLERLAAADAVVLTSSIALVRATDAGRDVPDPTLVHALRERLAGLPLPAGRAGTTAV